FLAGAELDMDVLRSRWKETTTIGLVAFLAPFLGCAAAAYWVLHWSRDASWLAGIALSTTSVAVVYAVMLEFGFNRTVYGKVVLAACFINDLATVLGLGLMFSPFTWRTAVFVGGSILGIAILPWLTPRFFRLFGNRPSELEAKYLLLMLFGFGALAAWADSEAVLPAYVIGMGRLTLRWISRGAPAASFACWRSCGRPTSPRTWRPRTRSSAVAKTCKRRWRNHLRRPLRWA